MLILLDIDGVMVVANSWKSPEFLNDGFPAFSSKAVDALQKIISETSADIVLTTSHKSKYSLEDWKDIFCLRNINVKNIDRLPENTNFLSRKNEIMNWINTSKDFTEFIIIDDDKSLNALPDFIKKKFIQTNSSLGLTNELANQALQIIKEEKYSY
jgi:16S rRNA C1402 (ribose-2'-O) methylase RsmI